MMTLDTYKAASGEELALMYDNSAPLGWNVVCFTPKGEELWSKQFGTPVKARKLFNNTLAEYNRSRICG